ncbi:Uncharacterised protein [Pseudomonas aeruginosa]|nr:Uncharacterised protein [Pseudomonas aeruginosa]
MKRGPPGAASSSVIEAQLQVLLLAQAQAPAIHLTVSGASGSATGMPSRRRPPPAARRRTAPREACRALSTSRLGQRQALRQALAGDPDERQPGRPARHRRTLPRAASAAARAASAPWARAVAALARTTFASFSSAPCKAAQAAHLVHRQFAEQGEEASDIAIVAVAPELPEIERRQPLGVEPDRALRRLAHLASVTGGQQRHGQAEQLGAALAPRQLHAVDDVRPLVGAAELQGAAMPARQFDEVVRPAAGCSRTRGTTANARGPGAA